MRTEISPVMAARSLRLLVAILLPASLLVLPIAPAQAARKAPVGVWAGPGDSSQAGDFWILAIEAGPAGNQRGYLIESKVHRSLCGSPLKPAYTAGRVSMSGNRVSLKGDLRCASTGTVAIPGIRYRLIYDTEADSFTRTPGEPGGPLTRQCGSGNTTMVGTPGDDALTGTDGPDVIDGRGGNDVIRGGGGMDILCGADGNDVLIGGAGHDVMLGEGGADAFRGGTGADAALGAKGRDRARGLAGHDSFLGGAGNDLFRGGGGRDHALGGPANDRLLGNAGWDTLIGEAGTDSASGGPGRDTCKAETEVGCEA